MPSPTPAPGDRPSAAGTGWLGRADEGLSFRAASAISQPLMAWVNRPTYQQAGEIQSHRSR
jgi:hypothetical protein